MVGSEQNCLVDSGIILLLLCLLIAAWLMQAESSSIQTISFAVDEG
jgi:hypothetical protein